MVKILYFSWVRDKINKEQEDIFLPKNILTVKDLCQWLVKNNSSYATIFKNTKLIKVAINQEYASFNDLIKDTDEIAFFPPVTGG
ncbi:MAG: molybdopterin converting factor subunit 1 [Alphaproteobacteria bacterium]|nr:molybdopterin converting factor subunit 1 [Alphaproteobacteria bacterium]